MSRGAKMACPTCNGIGRRFRVGPLWERTAPKIPCETCAGSGSVPSCPAHADGAPPVAATKRFGARDYCEPCADGLHSTLLRSVG